MTDLLPPGRYTITQAIDVPIELSPVGSNLDGDPSLVILAGEYTIWIATPLENGNYFLALESSQDWFSRDRDGNVVVVPPGTVPAGEWTIRSLDGGSTYSIERPDFRPTMAWSLSSIDPGTQVKLKVVLRPEDAERFNFRPVLE